MGVILINKVLLMFFIMASLNVVRHTYYFVQAWVKSETDVPEKYRVSNKSLWVLTISIGYVFSSIIYGLFV